MKPKFLHALPLWLSLLSQPLWAAAYTWDGGAGNGLWTNGANWVGDPTPTFDSSTDLTFAGTVQPANSIVNATTVRSITFNTGATSFSLSTRAAAGPTQLGKTLTFSAATGNATITVNSTVTSHQTINGGNVTGSGTGGAIVLASSLDVIQNADRYQTGTDINGPIYFYPKLTLGQNSNGITGSDTSISGSGGINKSGAGILLLAGANTFTGGVTISNGRVELQNNTAAGTNTIALANTGAELEIGAGITVSNALTISNTGNAKTLRHLDDSSPGDPVYAGQITINESSDGNFKVQIGANDLMSISGQITGNGGAGLQKTGAGTLIITNINNNYSGVTTLSNGILNFSANTLSSGNISMNDGTLQWGTNNTQDVSARIVMLANKTAFFDTNNNQVSFATAIGSNTNANLTKLGAGTLTLNHTNTYTGLTSVNAGHLLVTNTGNLAANSSLTVNDAATTEIQSTNATLNTVTNNNATDNALHFSATTGTTTITTLTGTGHTTIGNSASITTASSGTIHLQGATNQIITLNSANVNLADNAQVSISNGNATGNISGNNASITKTSAGSLTLGGTNTHTGGTFVSNGTLHVSSNANLGSGAVTINGGELNVSGNITKTVTLSSGKVSGTSTGITVNVTGASALTGSLGIVDTGTSSTRAINTTGNLSLTHLSGQGQFSGGLVTITQAHNPGNSPGTQSFLNGLAYANDSTITLEIASNGLSSDLIEVTGGLTIGTNVQVHVNLYGTADYSSAFWDTNHTFNLLTTDTSTNSFQAIDFSGLGTSPSNGSWNVTQNLGNITATWTAVPEPSSTILFSIALSSLCLIRRRSH